MISSRRSISGDAADEEIGRSGRTRYGCWAIPHPARRSVTCAAAQVTLLLAGWGMAQHPYLVRPDLPISSSAASPEMLRLLLIILAAGGVLLFPAIYLLFRVFKKKALFGR